ncbi:MAG TPA: virulence factor [Acidimicrobiia bacterium]|nr:virulence factor [Acidimicrobiia bacterium]
MSTRSNEPQLTIISWRDIPAQVVAKRGRESAKKELSARFQVAIDRAAMYAGLFGTDEYLAEWKRASRPCGADLEIEVAQTAAELEASFTSEVLNELAGSGGFREDG